MERSDTHHQPNECAERVATPAPTIEERSSGSVCRKNSSPQKF
jgi:hypothetical protein